MMLTPFPADCCVLVVEDEPVQALDLACMLAGFGCAVIGPVDSAREALQLLGRRRPSFALFDANLPVGSLVPLAEALTRLQLPFAVLATGLEHRALDRLSVLREAPRLTKPFSLGDLHQAASVLHQIDLCSKIAATDRRISEGRMRLAQQNSPDRAARGSRHAHGPGQFVAARDRPDTEDHAGKPRHPAPAARGLRYLVDKIIRRSPI